MQLPERTRRDAEVSLEKAREVCLVGEAGAESDVGKGGAWGIQQAARALETNRKKVLMRRAPNRFLERASEVRRRQARFASKRIDREMGGRLRLHELEHSPPNGRSEPTAREVAMLGRRSGQLHQLKPERSR
jgi:hypothetical protein